MAEYDGAGNLLKWNIGNFGFKTPISSYYFLKDHIGNIRVTVNQNGSVVTKDDFYPFGLQMPGLCYNAGNDNDRLKFSGKELDEEGGLYKYHFGWRDYDPELGRWYVVDPMRQGISPYVGIGNNPIGYYDEDGRFIPLLIAMGVGAIINTASNWDHIVSADNFWQGLGRAAGYAGIGALQGASAMIGGPAGFALSGAVGGLGNGMMRGLSGNQLLANTVVGGVAGLAGGVAGQWAGQNLGGVVVNGFNVSANSAIGGFVTGAVGGAAGGYAGGFLSGYIMSGGDIAAANQAGINGMWMGAGIGGTAGAVNGYISADKTGLDPWTGKPKKSITIGRGQKKRVDNFAKRFRNETISEPWEKEFGKGRVSDDMGLSFNEKWIKIKIEEGYTIYDLGQPKNYGFSKYYNMELNTIRNFNYSKVYRVYYWRKIQISIYKPGN